MSHQPERKDKDCLNCGATVIGRYCHICGQENVVTKESFWSLTKHFVYDILHFDSKFFDTLKYIFTKPGLVQKEYIKGRRVSFLHPIRMYLFTSAVFFLVFFTFENSSGLNITSTEDKPLTNKQRQKKIADYLEKIKEKKGDTTRYINNIKRLQDTSKPISYTDLYQTDTTRFNINGKEYRNIADYDSIQKTLPKEERDGWFMKSMSKKTLALNMKYKGNGTEMVKAIWEGFLHRLPYLLFISLPFFALILKLLYIRRKQFYYSDHVIFTLYHYIFSFILLLIVFAVNALGDWLNWDVFTIIIAVLLFTWPVYLFLEMKRFYGQGFGKTLGKFLLLNLIGFTIISLLTIALFVFAIFQM